MILRKFINHIRAQDWLATGLDVCVVIIGIFLGLQVNAWNEDREASKAELRYLERIKVDLDESVYDQSHQIKIIADLVPKLINVSIALESGQDNPEALKFLGEIPLWLGETARPIIHFSTLNEMQSSGHLGLIQDEELRIQFSILRQGQRIRTNVQANTQALQYSFHEALRRPFDITPKPSGDGYNVDFDFEALKQDREFKNAIGWSINYYMGLKGSLEGQLNDIVDVQGLVKAAIMDHKNYSADQ